jgi:hypothetical protein
MYGIYAVISQNLKGMHIARLVLGLHKSDVWLQDANIKTGVVREDGINVSRNGMIYLSMHEKL